MEGHVIGILRYKNIAHFHLLLLLLLFDELFVCLFVTLTFSIVKLVSVKKFSALYCVFYY